MVSNSCPLSLDNQNLVTHRDEQCFSGNFASSGLFADQIFYFFIIIDFYIFFLISIQKSKFPYGIFIHILTALPNPISPHMSLASIPIVPFSPSIIPSMFMSHIL